MTYNQQAFVQAAADIVDIAHYLHRRGWAPATSGNYSIRLDAEVIAITTSGKHKDRLKADDVMVVNSIGEPVSQNGAPSAETRLHTQLYDWNPDIGAVLHSHSVNTSVITLARPDVDTLVFQGYEIQKAFDGYDTHECYLRLPVFDNTQNMNELADEVAEFLKAHPDTPGYLIRGHGAYTWGKTMADAKRHLEAVEFLLTCELESMRLDK